MLSRLAVRLATPRRHLRSYVGTTLRGEHVRPLFFQPNHVVFSAHRRRFDHEQAIGDRHSYLFREILDQNDTGRCVWSAMLVPRGRLL